MKLAILNRLILEKAGIKNIIYSSDQETTLIALDEIWQNLTKCAWRGGRRRHSDWR
jgi:hypothetical protein